MSDSSQRQRGRRGRRHSIGVVMATKKTQKAATGPTCAIDGCDKPVYVRGVCEVHWNDPKA
jgi:hypothetical protein